MLSGYDHLKSKLVGCRGNKRRSEMVMLRINLIRAVSKERYRERDLKNIESYIPQELETKLMNLVSIRSNKIRSTIN